MLKTASFATWAEVIQKRHPLCPVDLDFFLLKDHLLGRNIFSKNTSLSILSVLHMVFAILLLCGILSSTFFSLTSSSFRRSPSTKSFKESSYEDSGKFLIISMSSRLPSMMALILEVGDMQL